MDGLGQFTFEAFKHIVKSNPKVNFVFIFDRPPHSDFIFADNISTDIISPQAKHPFLYRIWYQFSLKKLLKKVKPDIFVGTNGMVPLNTSTKTLSVIHDLNFEQHPEHLPFSLRNYYCKNFPKFAKKSNRIATVSEYSKSDIVKSYKIDASKIDVVYNGPNENFIPITESEIKKIQEKYSEGRPYFLFVGTLHPRKNLVRLFEAFDQFKTNTNSKFKLVIVGRKMWWTNEIENSYNKLKHKNDVIFTGRVSNENLYKITAAAHTLTYVPIFEGFGIPLVEAMSSGVPVITSNVTSMPEVAEDAGLIVNPFSVEEIANAMDKITADYSLRAELSKKSIEQAKKFSWQQTGDLLWASILKTIDA